MFMMQMTELQPGERAGGGEPLGGSVIMAHLSITLQPVVVVTEATVLNTVL